MKKSYWLWGGASVLALAVVSYLLSGGNGQKAELVKPRVGVLEATLKETGYLVPRGDYTWYSPMATTVLEVFKKPGDAVKKGEVLIRLDDRPVRERLNRVKGELEALTVQLGGAATGAQVDAALEGVRQAELQLAEAETRYGREKALAEAGAAAPADLETLGRQVEEAKSRLAQAQAALRQARALQDKGEAGQRLAALEEEKQRLEKDLGEMEFKAPFDGVLVEGNWAKGQKVDGALPVVRIARPGALEIQVDVLHEEAWKVEVGQQVEVSHKGTRTKTRAQVIRIGGRAESKISPLGLEQRRVPVTLALDEVPSPWKEGYPVEVRFPWKSREGLLIPKTAMLPSVEGAFVFKAVDGIARRVPVVIGAVGEQEVLVAEGLTTEDSILASTQGIQEGQKIR